MSHHEMPPSSRFYAIIESGRMECPKCGRILLWGTGRTAPDQKDWNPICSVIRCRQCETRYALGVVAWPVGNGPRKIDTEGRLPAPVDQQMTLRQIAEVRQRTGGFWARSPRGGEPTSPVNVYIEAGCTCDPLPWREGCPVHGVIQRLAEDRDQ